MHKATERPPPGHTCLPRWLDRWPLRVPQCPSRPEPRRSPSATARDPSRPDSGGAWPSDTGGGRGVSEHPTAAFPGFPGPHLITACPYKSDTRPWVVLDWAPQTSLAALGPSAEAGAAGLESRPSPGEARKGTVCRGSRGPDPPSTRASARGRGSPQVVLPLWPAHSTGSSSRGPSCQSPPYPIRVACWVPV